MKILFIDDDAVLRELMKRMLGAHCKLTVVTPEDAVLQIETGDHDLIVSDLYMDSLTGLDVVKLAQSRPDRQVPVIVVSAGSEEDRLLQQAISEGACGFIEKPFGNHREFLDKVFLLSGVQRVS